MELRFPHAGQAPDTHAIRPAIGRDSQQPRARSLACVDGCAGRARYTSGEAGSPLLLLDVAQDVLSARSTRLREFVCHFVESDPDNYANLREEVERHPAVQSERVEYRLYNGSFTAVSDDIMREIQRRGQPSFWFADPFGYDDIPIATLGRALTLPKAEVLVNVMFDFINRAMGIEGNPALAAVLDRLVGCDDWREIAALKQRERERAFVELYRRQLKRYGATHVIPFRMGDDERLRTLYYLVHATKHRLGATVMKDAMVASGTPGQLGYAGVDQHRMVPLFDLDVDALPSFLLDRFAGQTVAFDHILGETIDETGTCRECDYRACLKSLERDGHVTIRRITSKARGLSGLDQVSFPARP